MKKYPRGADMIKEYRIKRGYTQEQLSEMLNISTRQLQRIEKEECKTSIKTLKKIRKLLNVPDEDMIKVLYDKEEKKDSILT